jgi:hypothetical protein
MNGFYIEKPSEQDRFSRKITLPPKGQAAFFAGDER